MILSFFVSFFLFVNAAAETLKHSNLYDFQFSVEQKPKKPRYDLMIRNFKGYTGLRLWKHILNMQKYSEFVLIERISASKCIIIPF